MRSIIVVVEDLYIVGTVRDQTEIEAAIVAAPRSHPEAFVAKLESHTGER